jgi:endoglucanase
MAKKSNFGNFELLKQLTETPGVSGREERIRDLLTKSTKGMWDSVETDAMGSLICLKKARVSAAARKKSPPRKVMLACHMDEIGFYVRYIEDNGYLRIQNAGGFDTRNLFAKRVLVQGKRDLIGVLNPGGKPVHMASEEDRKKIPEISDFFIDLCLPKAQVDKLVQVGDPVTLIQQTEMIGDCITGKAMDNRVALWAGVNAIQKAGANLKYDVYFVACVQEEVGVRGATTSAFSIAPDIGIAIDVTLACDTPGVSKSDAVTELGKGVGIKIMDSLSISHRGLVDEFIAVAKAKRIPHQLEILPRGGTDAGAVQRAGVGSRAITLSVPTRYIHTVTETIHKKDASATVDVLAAWLSK